MIWAAASAAWLALSLAPFALVGESFGMLWFPANQPLSDWVERELGVGAGDWALVVLVSAVNAVGFGGLLALPWVVGLWVLPAVSIRKRRRLPPNPRQGLVDLSDDEAVLASATDARGRPTPGDAIQRRVQWLVEQRLELVASAAGGWDLLYRDPLSGSLWELDHPHSELQGGGPQRLTRIGAAEAREKYGPPADLG